MKNSFDKSLVLPSSACGMSGYPELQAVTSHCTNCYLLGTLNGIWYSIYF